MGAVSPASAPDRPPLEILKKGDEADSGCEVADNRRHRASAQYVQRYRKVHLLSLCL